MEGRSLNTFFVRYGCRTLFFFSQSPFFYVSIPSSSGMGVGPKMARQGVEAYRLNTFFVRYGCRTPPERRIINLRRCLNTFFVRYGCRTKFLRLLRRRWRVSIPSSSGMGVGHRPQADPSKITSQYLLRQVWVSDEREWLPCKNSLSQYLLRQVWVSDVASDTIGLTYDCLNTFFVRYGCRTTMAVAENSIRRSQYLLRQVWVSDPGTSKNPLQHSAL